ncbi:MAG TPA: AraC family transcriptional regulator [Coleofasciculaceae cyanobacterium]|jgi:AraC-like DNA-binding protein
MTLTLNESDWDELHQQAPEPRYPNLILDDFEELEAVPERLGRGYCRHMELCSGVWLSLSDQQMHQSWVLKVPAHDHLVQCAVVLSGLVQSEDIYPAFGGQRSYFSGSGISPSYAVRHERSQRVTQINIHLLPSVLETFWAGMEEGDATLLKLLIKRNDWKVSFFPTVTAAMRRVAEQIWAMPYCGSTRRIYLQAKVFELLALQLQPIVSDQTLLQPPPGRKPDTIARIYHAKEVLASRLENPPGLFDLAQHVGVSDRTLQRGFRDVFGTTVVGSLIQQRLESAEQLLRQGNCTVAEAAVQVGYGNMGHFAVAFKRRFGITPSQCLTGRKATSKS